MATDDPTHAPTELRTGEPRGEAGGQGFGDSVKNGAAGEYLDDAMQCEATRLMTAVQAGDAEAFERLAQDLRNRAYMVARSLVGSREDAMELCQETLLKVYRARGSYNPSQPFLPWFHRILRNTCFSFLRKHKRLKRRSLTFVDEAGDEIDFEIVDPAPGPSAGIEREERKAVFQRAISQLSARDREILALRHYQDLPYKAIASTLGIPEGTVMSRLFHARRRLREALGPLLDDLLSELGTGGDKER